MHGRWSHESTRDPACSVYSIIYILARHLSCVHATQIINQAACRLTIHACTICSIVSYYIISQPDSSYKRQPYLIYISIRPASRARAHISRYKDSMTYNNPCTPALSYTQACTTNQPCTEALARGQPHTQKTNTKQI